MPSLIGDMLATYGVPMQHFACGVPVRLKRGIAISEEFTAVVTVEKNEITDESGGVMEIIESRNYEILTSDYLVNGDIVEPQDGDAILETINGADCRFRSMSIGKLPAWQRLDNDGARWLLRTKLTSEKRS